MTARPDLITIAAAALSEQRVKGSRFLASVDRCAEPAAAQAFIEQARADHAAASHVCYAYRLGRDERFSDDGEPGGTAGRPMMELLARRKLDRVVAVVVRYFGGTKLGAGGLARAYAGTLARALDRAGVARLPALVALEVSAPFAASDTLFRLLDERPEVRRGRVDYRPDGVRVALQLPERDLAALALAVQSATGGSAALSDPKSLPHLNPR